MSATGLATGIATAIAIMEAVSRLGYTASLWVTVIQRARSEGRDINGEEKAAIRARLDEAKIELTRAIEAAEVGL